MVGGGEGVTEMPSEVRETVLGVAAQLRATFSTFSLGAAAADPGIQISKVPRLLGTLGS